MGQRETRPWTRLPIPFPGWLGPPLPRAPTLSWAGIGFALGFLPLILTFAVGALPLSQPLQAFSPPPAQSGMKESGQAAVQPPGTEAPLGVAAALLQRRKKNVSSPKKERENVTIPEKNAITFGMGVTEGLQFLLIPISTPPTAAPAPPHTCWWGSPSPAHPRQAHFPNPGDPRPQPTFAMVGEGAHFSLFLFPLGGSGLEKPVFCWDPFLQSLTPPTPTSRNSPWRPTHQ